MKNKIKNKDFETSLHYKHRTLRLADIDIEDISAEDNSDLNCSGIDNLFMSLANSLWPNRRRPKCHVRIVFNRNATHSTLHTVRF